jgi:type VI protein secretion system component Hcp
MKSLKVVTLIAIVVYATSVFAAVDAFLKIEGIKGESTDPSHRDWIAISGFSWGAPNASPRAAAAVGRQACATNEIKFTVTGNAVPLLTQKCQTNERLPEWTLDFQGQRHVLQGAVIRSCQNNMFTVHFDRCATHAAVPVMAASMVNPNNSQPNAQIFLGTDTPENMSIVGVQVQGPNRVVLKQRGASSKLMLACAKGEHFKEAKLTMRKAGGTQQEYLVIKMSDVLVSSYQVNGDGTVAVGLKFAKSDGSFAALQDAH